MSSERPTHNNFLGLPPERSDITRSKVAILQAPLENTTSFQHGTAQGPQAILRASREVETYDIESGRDFSEVGITTFSAPDLKGLKSEEALDLIEADVERALDAGLWPLTLGGEHTASLAPVRVLHRRHPDLSVLQIDAHADLRDSYEGSRYSHASIMKRIHDLGVPHVGVGIRNYSREEADLIRAKKIKIVHDHDIVRGSLKPAEICKGLTKKVYLSVDVDGFTAGEVPGTGTPEPGGIGWWHAMELFAYLFRNFDVVGADVMELMPLASSQRSEFFAAKLAYRMIGMKFCS